MLSLSIEHKLCKKVLHDSIKANFLKIKARKIVMKRTCHNLIVVYVTTSSRMQTSPGHQQNV